jgi:hypothetical protein
MRNKSAVSIILSILNIPLLMTAVTILPLSSCHQIQGEKNKSGSTGAVWPKTTKEMHPWTRWWWMGNAVNKETLEGELKLFADAGIGGVEITPIYGAKGFESEYINFLSPQWMNMLKITVEKSKSLGLGVDMNCGTGWPFGGPQISPGNAAGKLIIQIYKLQAKQKLKDRITVQDSLQQKLGAKLIALTAYCSNGEILDILEKTDKNGNLDWSPKNGNSEIYAAFSGHTGQIVKRAAPGGEGLVMDHLSKEALKIYLKRFDDAFVNNQAGVRSFFNDSYEVYRADFTPGLFDEFQKRRGYDVRKYLKELVSRENSDKTARIRSDYRQTIAEMIYENFSVPWHQWVNRKGGLSRNQAHGSPGNLIDIYAIADIPEPESFGFNHEPIPGINYYSTDTRNVPPDRVMMKFASSASNITGKPLTSCETFTWLGEHFKIPLSHTKPQVENVFLAGVNHVFFHGTTYSPEKAGWPGWLFYASTNFVPANSFWPHLKGMTEYITRCQSILQAGTSDSEVMLYWPYADVLYNAKPVDKLDAQIAISSIPLWLKPTSFYKNATGLIDSGYCVDFVSDMLLGKCEVKNGLLSASPKGSSYRVLAIPKTDFMPLETFTNILKLADQGASVVFEKMPDNVPGFINLVARQKQLNHMTSSVKFSDKGNGIKLAKTGKGQIILSADVQKALQYINVHCEKLTASGLEFIRRDINGDKYYFLVNHTAQPTDAFIPLEVTAASVMILDPQTGRYGLAESLTAGRGIKVRLQIDPGNALILKTSKEKITEEKKWRYVDSRGTPLVVSGTWKLKFTSGGPVCPGKQTLTSLISWTKLTDPNAPRFSGMGEYSITFQLTSKAANDYLLDLGDVRESARVWVNGRDAGILWHVPFKVDIGPYLKQGKNSLRIEVANLMANRIIDLDKRKVEWRKFYEINFVNLNYKPFNASDWEPMESGLLGPITITPLN